MSRHERLAFLSATTTDGKSALSIATIHGANQVFFMSLPCCLCLLTYASYPKLKLSYFQMTKQHPPSIHRLQASSSIFILQ